MAVGHPVHLFRRNGLGVLVVEPLGFRGKRWNSVRIALAGANQELRQSMETLQALQDELVRAEKPVVLTLMVAGVAHELNTPLGSATVALSVLEQRTEQLRSQMAIGLKNPIWSVSLPMGRMGEIATAAIERAAGLVKQFKQLAVDRTTMEARIFDLAEVVRNAHPLLRRWDDKRLVRLALKLLFENLPMDSYPVREVVGNLVDNALMHAFPAGRQGVLRVSATAGESESAYHRRRRYGEDTGRDPAQDLRPTTRRHEAEPALVCIWCISRCAGRSSEVPGLTLAT